MPRLVTPKQAAYEEYRKRQQDRTRGAPGVRDVGQLGEELPDLGKTTDGKTPLGLDPVEGPPVDLSEVYNENAKEPVDNSIEMEFSKLLRDDAPEGFGEGLE